MGEIYQHLPDVRRWIEAHDLDLLITLGGLTDHPDHRASGMIGKIAAAQLNAQTGRAESSVGVLELQNDWHTGDVVAAATEGSMAAAFGAAMLFGSQMQVQHFSADTPTDWPIVAAGYAISPDTYAGLYRYPILRDASFVYYPARSLSVLGATEMAGLHRG
jgi:hypothetical protein